MAFRMDLWAVEDGNLQAVKAGAVDLEKRLEGWIAADPSLTGLDVVIIGRQVITEFGGRIDLLGLDLEGNTVLFELKKGKTPRDVVAQLLDYASWISDRTFSDLDAIFGPITPASYIVIHDVRADSWGFQGKTQEYRFIQSQSL